MSLQRCLRPCRKQDTTAWTIGRIFEFLHDAHIEPSIITRDTLPPLISVLLEALKDASHIAVRVCYALGKLAEGFKEHKGGWTVVAVGQTGGCECCASFKLPHHMAKCEWSSGMFVQPGSRTRGKTGLPSLPGYRLLYETYC